MRGRGAEETGAPPTRRGILGSAVPPSLKANSEGRIADLSSSRSIAASLPLDPVHRYPLDIHLVCLAQKHMVVAELEDVVGAACRNARQR